MEPSFQPRTSDTTRLAPPKRRLWPWLLGATAVFVVAVPLLSYGTLSPCEMLKKDLRLLFITIISEQSSASTGDPWAQAGKNLGLAMAMFASGPLIENVVGSMSPIQCVDRLIRMKANQRPMLADLQQRLAAARAAPGPPTSEPKPRLDWRQELKVRNDSWTKEYGYVHFKGEVENIGGHTIRSLTIHVWYYDRSGKEISRDSHPIVYGFSDGMRPGHIKPFAVMSQQVSTMESIRYAFAIGDYD